MDFFITFLIVYVFIIFVFLYITKIYFQNEAQKNKLKRYFEQARQNRRAQKQPPQASPETQTRYRPGNLVSETHEEFCARMAKKRLSETPIQKRHFPENKPVNQPLLRNTTRRFTSAFPSANDFSRNRPFKKPWLPLEKQQDKTTFSYKSRNNIFTKAELTFYKRMLEFCPKHLTIMSKTRLCDIINPSQFSKVAFWKIQAKHVDFVVVNETGKILKVIELDDYTHDRADRQERDAFVDEALESAGVEIVHIRGNHNMREIFENC